jgi:hypothetical protein
LATRRYRKAQPNRTINGISRTIRRPRHARDASTAQAENVFVAIRKAINNHNARADTAVRPYAEILHPTGRQYLLQRRGHYAEIWHPPRKRESNNDDRKQLIFETRGRAQRPSPTRRCDIRQAGSIRYNVAMSGRVRQAEFVFVAIRKAINNRNARADTAVRPYAEIWHPMGKRRTCLWPSEKQLIIVTRGRAQRPSSTRRFGIHRASGERVCGHPKSN